MKLRANRQETVSEQMKPRAMRRLGQRNPPAMVVPVRRHSAGAIIQMRESGAELVTSRGSLIDEP